MILQTSSFTQDWTTRNSYWLQIAEIARLQDRDIEYLEVGCYEGRTTVWVLDNFPKAHATVIDIFEDNDPESGVYQSGYDQRFLDNLNPYASRMRGAMKGTSTHWLSNLIDRGKSFDLIYVDGSHVPSQAAIDGLLSFEVLKPGGVMIFDDYGVVKDGVDGVVAAEGFGCQVLFREHQLILRKGF